MENYDIIIIGAGFFGVRMSLFFAQRGFHVLLLERENDILMRASWSNQARIHNGYHYPRNYSTAYSSHKNYEKFIDNYRDCVFDQFKHIYAISNQGSKVNAYQFKQFCKIVDIPCTSIDLSKFQFINPASVEEAFIVEEKAIDFQKVREKLRKEIEKYKNIKLMLNSSVNNIEILENKATLSIEKSEKTFSTKNLYNVTYSGINFILKKISQQTLKIKNEITEICLVKLPEEIINYGFTVMDGDFFSCMPAPAHNCHSLTHVYYTPHLHWDSSTDNLNPYNFLENYEKVTRYNYMKNASSKYVPLLYNCQYIKSLYEIKAIPIKNEFDDGRPILYIKHHESPSITSVLGSKFDCIYELEEVLQKEYDNNYKS